MKNTITIAMLALSLAACELDVDQSDLSGEVVEGPEIELKSGADGPDNRPTSIDGPVLTLPNDLDDPEEGEPGLIEIDMPELEAPFQFDTSGIQRRPSGKLPANSTDMEAFELENIVQQLTQTRERFDDIQTIGTRERLRSASWSIEVDKERGLLTVHSRLQKPRVSRRIDPRRLQAMSIRRLTQWGVNRAEISRVMQRNLMRQDRSDQGGVGRPSIHRYKTFVNRGIEGIPVSGHRAVVTHALDGSFHRASISWPAFAENGHRLRTPLSVEEITQRTARVLVKEDVHGGPVQLRWVFVPTSLEDGTVELELKAVARVEGVAHDDHVEETRYIEIAVDAG